MKRCLIATFWVIVTLAVRTIPVIAQGSLREGETVTRSGEVVAGVSLIFAVGAIEVTTVSDRQGVFRLQLQPGDYRVRVSGPGIVDRAPSSRRVGQHG